MVLQPSQQSADEEEVRKLKSCPSFMYFYCKFEPVAAQLTFSFLLALSIFHLNSIVYIKTGNGGWEHTIPTVSRWGGGEKFQFLTVIFVFLSHVLACCSTTNLSFDAHLSRSIHNIITTFACSLKITHRCLIKYYRERRLVFFKCIYFL